MASLIGLGIYEIGGLAIPVVADLVYNFTHRNKPSNEGMQQTGESIYREEQKLDNVDMTQQQQQTTDNLQFSDDEDFEQHMQDYLNNYPMEESKDDYNNIPIEDQENSLDNIQEIEQEIQSDISMEEQQEQSTLINNNNIQEEQKQDNPIQQKPYNVDEDQGLFDRFVNSLQDQVTNIIFPMNQNDYESAEQFDNFHEQIEQERQQQIEQQRQQNRQGLDPPPPDEPDNDPNDGNNNPIKGVVEKIANTGINQIGNAVIDKIKNKKKDDKKEDKQQQEETKQVEIQQDIAKVRKKKNNDKFDEHQIMSSTLATKTQKYGLNVRSLR